MIKSTLLLLSFLVLLVDVKSSDYAPMVAEKAEANANKAVCAMRGEEVDVKEVAELRGRVPFPPQGKCYQAQYGRRDVSCFTVIDYKRGEACCVGRRPTRDCHQVQIVQKRYCISMCDYKKTKSCYKHRPCTWEEFFGGTARRRPTSPAQQRGHCCFPTVRQVGGDRVLATMDSCFQLQSVGERKCVTVVTSQFAGPCCRNNPFCAHFRSVKQRVCVRYGRQRPVCCQSKSGANPRPCTSRPRDIRWL